MTADGIKRGIDAAVAALLLLILSPLLAAIALLLLTVQGRPVIYSETRIGLRGRPFSIYKFRTMLPRLNDTASVAPQNDPRITPVGKLLKPSRLDELPQLVNVLTGDMSLVGPRPLRETHLRALAPEIAACLLSVRPGITSPAGIAFIAEDEILAEAGDPERTYTEIILPAKAAAQRDYVQSWSLLGDWRVLLTTLTHVWSPAAWQTSRRMIRGLLRAGSSSP